MQPPLAARRLALRRLGAGTAALALTGLSAGVAPAWADELPGVIAAAKPSVLPVGSYSATGSPRFAFRGTGFVIGDGRLVVTNFHVLPEAQDGQGELQLAVAVPRINAAGDAQVRMARTVATDRLRDLALLQIDGPPLPALALAEPGTAREGQAIALMGFPLGGTLGYSMVTHRGIVAAITTVALPAPTARQLDPRAVVRLRDGNFEVIQLDATAYPGNSGGPVVDASSGRVLGIVNQVLVRNSRESAMSSPSGITYAIPVGLVQELLREFRAGNPAQAR
jgi:serine protease Do